MSGEEFVERNQRFAVNLVMGLIAWIFSVFLFLPLTQTYTPDWAGLVSVILVAGISYYLIIAKLNSAPLIEYVSNKLTITLIDRRKLDIEDRQTHLRNVEKAVKIGLLLIVYLLYRPLLWLINPSLSGLTFIMVILYLLKILLQKT